MELNDYNYAIVDIDYSRDRVKLYSRAASDCECMNVALVKHLYNNGAKILGVYKDKLGRIRLKTIKSIKTKCNSKHEFSDTGDLSALAKSIYNILPSAVYPYSSSREKRVKELESYIQSSKMKKTGLAMVNIDGMHGVAWQTKVKVSDAQEIDIRIIVYVNSYTGITESGQATYVGLPKCMIIDLKRGKEIASWALVRNNHHLDDEITQCVNDYIGHRSNDSSYIESDIKVNTNFVSRRYTTVLNGLRNKLRRIGGDYAFISRYILGVIYGYDGKYIKLNTIKVFKSGVQSGVKWALMLGDKTIWCSVAYEYEPISNRDDTLIVRYRIAGKSVSVNMLNMKLKYDFNNYVFNHVGSDKSINRIHNDLLTKLIGSNANKYLISDNNEDLYLATLPEVVPYQCYPIMQITKDLVDAIGDKGTDKNIQVKPYNIISTIAINNTSVDIIITYRDESTMWIKYSLRGNEIHALKIVVNESDVIPFSKVGLLNESAISRIISEIRADVKDNVLSKIKNSMEGSI